MAPERSRAAFEALYREHYGRVLGYALRRSSPDIANDVVSETFLVAWRRWGSIPDTPAPWLLGVARKVLANQRRSARRQQSFLASDARHQGELSNDTSPSLDGSNELLKALGHLPAADRDLLQLIAWDGLTPAEAAKALGLTSAVCRMRLHRARRRLAIELGRTDKVANRLPVTPMEDPQP